MDALLFCEGIVKSQQHHSSDKMTREYNRVSALSKITQCPLHLLDTAWRVRSIANTSGLTITEVEQLIAERRAREASHA